MRNVTLGEVREQVKEMAKDHYDWTAPISSIEFQSINKVTINEEDYDMTETAKRAICTRMRVPLQYMERCEPDLQQQNMNHWLQKEKNDSLFVRFNKQSVRTIFTPKYIPFDNPKVIDKMYENGFDDNTKVQFSLDDEMLMVNIPNAKSLMLKPEDELVNGLSIQNSEVGLSTLNVTTYCLRLICSNGMIVTHPEQVGKYRHISERIDDEFSNITQRIGEDTERINKQWQISLESEVRDHEATMKSFNTRFQLNTHEIMAAAWGFATDPGDRMFNIVNAYTKGAQYTDLSVESEVKLQRVGGKILSLSN